MKTTYEVPLPTPTQTASVPENILEHRDQPSGPHWCALARRPTVKSSPQNTCMTSDHTCQNQSALSQPP